MRLIIILNLVLLFGTTTIYALDDTTQNVNFTTEYQEFFDSLGSLGKQQFDQSLITLGKQNIVRHKIRDLTKDQIDKLYRNKGKTLLNKLPLQAGISKLRRTFQVSKARKTSIINKRVRALRRKNTLSNSADLFKIDVNKSNKDGKVYFHNDSTSYVYKVAFKDSKTGGLVASKLKDPLSPGMREFIPLNKRLDSYQALNVEIVWGDERVLFKRNPLSEEESLKLAESEEELKRLENEKLEF